MRVATPELQARRVRSSSALQQSRSNQQGRLQFLQQQREQQQPQPQPQHKQHKQQQQTQPQQPQQPQQSSYTPPQRSPLELSRRSVSPSAPESRCALAQQAPLQFPPPMQMAPIAPSSSLTAGLTKDDMKEIEQRRKNYGAWHVEFTELQRIVAERVWHGGLASRDAASNSRLDDALFQKAETDDQRSKVSSSALRSDTALEAQMNTELRELREELKLQANEQLQIVTLREKVFTLEATTKIDAEIRETAQAELRTLEQQCSAMLDEGRALKLRVRELDSEKSALLDVRAEFEEERQILLQRIRQLEASTDADLSASLQQSSQSFAHEFAAFAAAQERHRENSLAEAWAQDSLRSELDAALSANAVIHRRLMESEVQSQERDHRLKRQEIESAALAGELEASRAEWMEHRSKTEELVQSGPERATPTMHDFTANQGVLNALHKMAEGNQSHVAAVLGSPVPPLDRTTATDAEPAFPGRLALRSQKSGSRRAPPDVAPLSPLSSDTSVRTIGPSDISVPQRYVHVLEQVETRGWNSVTWREGYTLLHWAAEHGRGQLCRYLINLGADPKARDKRGRTPADFAMEGGHSDILPLLVSGGSSFDDALSPRGSETDVEGPAQKCPDASFWLAGSFSWVATEESDRRGATKCLTVMG